MLISSLIDIVELRMRKILWEIITWIVNQWVNKYVPLITLSPKFSQQIKSAILRGIQGVKQNINGSETELKIEYTIIWLKYISVISC